MTQPISVDEAQKISTLELAALLEKQHFLALEKAVNITNQRYRLEASRYTFMLHHRFWELERQKKAQKPRKRWWQR